jgi:hypothetical protein
VVTPTRRAHGPASAPLSNRFPPPVVSCPPAAVALPFKAMHGAIANAKVIPAAKAAKLAIPRHR